MTYHPPNSRRPSQRSCLIVKTQRKSTPSPSNALIQPIWNARAVRGATGHAVVAGCNYGQGSSREHAAIAPRNLGLRIVLAKGFARIHRQNLINYVVLLLVFADLADYDRLDKDDILHARDLRRTLESAKDITLECNGPIPTRHGLTAKQVKVILAGGLINWRRAHAGAVTAPSVPQPSA